MFGAVLIHCGIIAFIVLIVICLALVTTKQKKKLQKLANKPLVAAVC